MAKIPTCKYCGSHNHYSFKCFQAPRKEIKKTSIKRLTAVKTDSKQKTTQYPILKVERRTAPVSHRKQLIKELDTVFSRYIRLKASKDGVATCVTCLSRDSWKMMDAGHFIVRGKIGTRFEIANVHPQCVRCNRYKSGNMEMYQKYMLQRYGRTRIDELKKQSTERLETYKIEVLLKKYKQKLNELNEQNLY